MALAAKSFSDLITFTRASTAGYYGSDGLYKTAASGVARTGAYTDYNPSTLAKRGFLVEESRTNLLLRSNDWSASWGLVNVTQTPAQATGPDGTVSMTKLAATTTAATLSNQAFVATSTTMVYSIYVKQGSGAAEANEFAWYNNTTATTLVSLIINYATGVITQNLGTGATAEPIGNGIWRLSIPVFSGITVGNNVQIYSCFTGGVKTAGIFAYVYGAQVEPGSEASTYIPTTTAQVTRASDVGTINTLSPWFNAAEGTFYAEFAGGKSISGVYGRAIGYDGVRSFISANGAGLNSIGTWNNAVALTTNFTGNVLTGAKTAMAYSSAGRALVGNAGTVATDSSLIGTVTTVQLGNSPSVNECLNGHLRVVRYYPRRLTNAELQALTA